MPSEVFNIIHFIAKIFGKERHSWLYSVAAWQQARLLLRFFRSVSLERYVAFAGIELLYTFYMAQWFGRKIQKSQVFSWNPGIGYIFSPCNQTRILEWLCAHGVGDEGFEAAGCGFEP